MWTPREHGLPTPRPQGWAKNRLCRRLQPCVRRRNCRHSVARPALLNQQGPRTASSERPLSGRRDMLESTHSSGWKGGREGRKPDGTLSPLLANVYLHHVLDACLGSTGRAVLRSPAPRLERRHAAAQRDVRARAVLTFDGSRMFVRALLAFLALPGLVALAVPLVVGCEFTRVNGSRRSSHTRVGPFGPLVMISGAGAVGPCS